MSLSVLSIAFPFAPVAPSSAGGAEQVLRLVEREIVTRGHRSVVVAREDSVVAGELFAVPASPNDSSDGARARVTVAQQAAIDRALASRTFDVLHMHGLDFHRYALPEDVPVVVTLHLPPAWYPQQVWNLPDNFHLVCVSEAQQRACSPYTAHAPALVRNGVPATPQGDEPPSRGGYALMLSRICPEKNLHAGLDAARIAGVPAVLAGETYPYPEHLRYLREQIEPRTGPDARVVASVGGAEKLRLLRDARCLLLPTLAPETSSLAAMEALHAGTPVIAFSSGALPEIVQHGQTGFLVNSVEEMATAIRRLDEIDPAVCRAVAAERFALSPMVDGYLALYSALASRNTTSGRREAFAACNP